MATNNTTFVGSSFAGAVLSVKASTATRLAVGGLDQAYTAFTVRVDTTGSPASYSLQLQGSLDGSHWYNLGTAITADGVYSETTAGIFASWIRTNITTVSGGTSPTVTVTWSANS